MAEKRELRRKLPDGVIVECGGRLPALPLPGEGPNRPSGMIALRTGKGASAAPCWLAVLRALSRGLCSGCCRKSKGPRRASVIGPWAGAAALWEATCVCLYC